MKVRGFTAVELLVVISIMAILLVLAVVNVQSTQIDARDNERKVKADNFALQLETYYKNPASSVSGGGSRYPGTTEVTFANLKTIFPGFDFNNLRTPDNTNETTIDLVAATNANETTAGVTPQPTVGTYVYQPLNTDKTLCTSSLSQSCRRFNIYYQLEKDTTIYKISSKNQ